MLKELSLLNTMSINDVARKVTREHQCYLVSAKVKMCESYSLFNKPLCMSQKLILNFYSYTT